MQVEKLHRVEAGEQVVFGSLGCGAALTSPRMLGFGVGTLGCEDLKGFECNLDELAHGFEC